jgi:hypothetical protein
MTFKPHLFYQRINAALGADPIRLAALAVLSPQLTVRDNVRALFEIERKGDTRLGFPVNVDKACAILHTKNPTPYVRGPKVVEFYRSLMLTPGAICVDRHMLRWAGCGDQWTKRNVDHAKAEIREYAKAWNLETFEAQAQIWHGLAAMSSRADPADIVADLVWRIG